MNQRCMNLCCSLNSLPIGCTCKCFIRPAWVYQLFYVFTSVNIQVASNVNDCITPDVTIVLHKISINTIILASYNAQRGAARFRAMWRVNATLQCRVAISQHSCTPYSPVDCIFALSLQATSGRHPRTQQQCFHYCSSIYVLFILRHLSLCSQKLYKCYHWALTYSHNIYRPTKSVFASGSASDPAGEFTMLLQLSNNLCQQTLASPYLLFYVVCLCLSHFLLTNLVFCPLRDII